VVLADAEAADALSLQALILVLSEVGSPVLVVDLVLFLAILCGLAPEALMVAHDIVTPLWHMLIAPRQQVLCAGSSPLYMSAEQLPAK
jgi:hypothetical protein